VNRTKEKGLDFSRELTYVWRFAFLRNFNLNLYFDSIYKL